MRLRLTKYECLGYIVLTTLMYRFLLRDTLPEGYALAIFLVSINKGVPLSLRKLGVSATGLRSFLGVVSRVSLELQQGKDDPADA